MYQNLKKVREKKKLTLIAMGNVIGKSAANYLKKERGEVSITVKEALCIAAYLQESIEFLFQEF